MTTPLSLALTAAAVLTPWGDAAESLPGAAGVNLPKVRGFVGSRFSPLVHAVARACLGTPEAFAEPETAAAEPGHSSGRRTGIVLATLFGDTTTTDTSTQRVMDGQVHNPLLFFQSVTTSILGHLTKLYGITGPLNCVSGATGLASQALAMSDVVLASGDVDEVLVVGVECAPNERAVWVHDSLSSGRYDTSAPSSFPQGAALDALPAGDVAVGLLLRRATNGDGLSRLPAGARPEQAVSQEWAQVFGWLTPLVVAAEAHQSAAP
ncbi:beta-ketoacyl synthase N-terminal-like domain-containing protein [Streptomyces mirabilis]